MAGARELFATRGYEAVSLRKVAEAVEYTPAAIYVHFADKEALFRELASEDFRALAHAFHEIAKLPDPVVRVAEIGLAYCDFGVRHPNHYRLMFMTPRTPLRGPTRAGKDPSGKGNPAEDGYAFLRLCVTAAIEQGLLRPELTDPELVAQTMWAGVHGATSLEITMGADPWIEWRPFGERTRAMVRAVVLGAARHPDRYDQVARRGDVEDLGPRPRSPAAAPARDKPPARRKQTTPTRNVVQGGKAPPKGRRAAPAARRSSGVRP